jgi:hypothetical protein
MTVPETFAMLGSIVSDTLTDTGFIPDAAGVAIDDPDAVGPNGDEEVFLTWAALTRGETRTVRTILGRPKPRYVVEHRASLEMAWAGPDRQSGAEKLAQALAAIAALPGDNPTLSDTAERFFIEEGSEEGLSPNGWRTTLTCAFRIRSSDPLGLTP